MPGKLAALPCNRLDGKSSNRMFYIEEGRSMALECIAHNLFNNKLIFFISRYPLCSVVNM